MAVYRRHFLDTDDRIKAHEEIDAGSLLDAIDRATAMLNQRSHYEVVEVWAVTDGSTARGGKRDLPTRFAGSGLLSRAQRAPITLFDAGCRPSVAGMRL